MRFVCQQFSEIFHSVVFSFSIVVARISASCACFSFCGFCFTYLSVQCSTTCIQIISSETFRRAFAQMIDDKWTFFFFSFMQGKTWWCQERQFWFNHQSVRLCVFFLFIFSDVKDKLWKLCCTEIKTVFKHFVIPNECETLCSPFGGKAFEAQYMASLV